MMIDFELAGILHECSHTNNTSYSKNGIAFISCFQSGGGLHFIGTLLTTNIAKAACACKIIEPILADASALKA